MQNTICIDRQYIFSYTALNKDCYIVDKNSAKITVEDEQKAFEQAEKEFLAETASDEVLLSGAQQRAELLLEEYVRNIGNLFEKNYTIKWVHLDMDGNPADVVQETTTDKVNSES